MTLCVLVVSGLEDKGVTESCGSECGCYSGSVLIPWTPLISGDQCWSLHRAALRLDGLAEDRLFSFSRLEKRKKFPTMH